MSQVNMLEAKTRLSQLVQAVESGAEEEIVIARDGKPAARLMPMPKKQKIKFGVAKGKFRVPDDPNADDDYIDWLFYQEGPEPQ